MAKPKNKRLSEANRNQLVRFAKQQIAATHDTEELDAAYEVAADAISCACVANFPPRDMKVLAKYKMASPDQCLYVSPEGNGRYEYFEFRDNDKRIPLRPTQGCRNQPILIEGDAAKAWETYDRLKAADKEARDTRLNDFRALIQNATSFNGLAEVWPAIEVLREEIVGTSFALSTFSEETMARIKADPAFSQVAA